MPELESSVQKIKVAVLGGGVGAMTAVCELTDPNNPNRDRYEVTVYQLGWRLGGKGASGRNMAPEYAYRIEEHGLHIWFGFYDNAFRLIRKVYKELNRPPDAPLGTWDAAFKPHSSVVLKEFWKGAWGNWPGVLPTNGSLPGEGGVLPPWDYVIMAIKAIRSFFSKSSHADAADFGEPELLDEYLQTLVDALHTDKNITGATNQGELLIDAAIAFGELVQKEIQAAGGARPQLSAVQRDLLLRMLKHFMHWAWKRFSKTIKNNDRDRWLWINMNCNYGILAGCLENEALKHGLDCLNDMDFREFLSRYAYPDNDVTITSALIVSLYDGLFAFVDGDASVPPGHKYAPKANIEAGTTIRGAIRAGFMTRGAAMWRMQAGMGDTVFTPIYEVLKRRGVKFKFFHRVDALTASADGKSIETIQIGRQATLKNAAKGYQPFVEVKGLSCWPSTALYDQLVEGSELKSRNINLEALHNGWKDVETLELKHGQDFDVVMLGISLGALPYICCDLIQKSQKWHAMVNAVKTVQTEALQLWLSRTASQMGWKVPGAPIISGYDYQAPNPLNTWADLTHLLAEEAWPAQAHPLNLAYYCATLTEKHSLPQTDCGPKADADALDQAKANDSVRKVVVDFLNKWIEPLFPNALVTGPDGSRHFRWEWLVDNRPGSHAGEARLNAQYWRANVQPSDRYVLSVAGSTKHRLAPHDDAEFINLYLAGDWTRNGFNTGSVESAVMGGMLASTALCGFPRREDITTVDFL